MGRKKFQPKEKKGRKKWLSLSELGHPQVPEYKGYPRPKTRNEANEAKRVPASMTGCEFYPMIIAIAEGWGCFCLFYWLKKLLM